MTAPSKAAAARWLDDHVGQTIYTVQVRGGQVKWVPGPRTLSKAAKARWMLDQSSVTLGGHVATEMSDTDLVLDWRDSAGKTVHTTVYSTEATE